MAATKINYFNVSDVLALGGSFIPQSDKPTNTKKRAQGLKANGDENISKTYGGETKRVIVYEHQAGDGFITLPKVGAVIADLHIDSIEVEWQADKWPKITFNCHNHATNPHTVANVDNLYTSTVKLPAQFGIPRSLVEDVEANPADIFKLSADDAAIGVKSMKYTLGCVHLDDDIGDHLAGENRDGVEKLDVGMTGVPAAVTIGNGWDKLNDDEDAGNSKADESSLSLEHHIVRDVAA